GEGPQRRPDQETIQLRPARDTRDSKLLGIRSPVTKRSCKKRTERRREGYNPTVDEGRFDSAASWIVGAPHRPACSTRTLEKGQGGKGHQVHCAAINHPPPRGLATWLHGSSAPIAGSQHTLYNEGSQRTNDKRRYWEHQLAQVDASGRPHGRAWATLSSHTC